MRTTRFDTLVERTDKRAGARSIDLPLLSVSQSRGVVRFSDLHDRPPRAESLDFYKLVQRGDIVFNKMSIRSGALGLANEDGLATYHYEVMRPRLVESSKFIVYLMKSDWFTSELIRNERGIGAGGAAGVRTTEVPFTTLRTLRIPRFSYEIQQIISDYLDRETAEIDSLIRDLQQALDLREERLRSSIDGKFQAPSSAKEPLKRFGVSIKIGVSVNASNYSADRGRPGILRTGSVSKGYFDPGENKAVEEPQEIARLSAPVQQDTIIVNRANSPDLVGSAALVDQHSENLYLSDLLWQVALQRANPAFVAAYTLTHSYRDSIDLIRVGASASMQKISQEKFVNIPIPALPLAQQAAIADEVSRARQEFRETADDINRAITLAKERRAALITAAVTGQIDVTANRRPAAEQLEDDIKELS